jgi:hypothetical protein
MKAGSLTGSEPALSCGPLWVELRPHDACGADDFVAARAVVRDGNVHSRIDPQRHTDIGSHALTLDKPTDT